MSIESSAIVQARARSNEWVGEGESEPQRTNDGSTYLKSIVLHFLSIHYICGGNCVHFVIDLVSHRLYFHAAVLMHFFLFHAGTTISLFEQKAFYNRRK